MKKSGSIISKFYLRKKREKSKSIFVKKLKRFHDDHIEIVAWGIYQKNKYFFKDFRLFLAQKFMVSIHWATLFSTI